MSVLHVTRDDEHVRVLRGEGELDVVTAVPLLDRARELVRAAPAVVLDLSEVSFLDSAAVRLVDRLARSCGADGVRFCVVAPPDGRARRVLELAGMADLAADSLPSAVERATGHRS